MVGFQKTKVEPTVGVKFVSAGLAACSADLITFPLDVAKVRLQIQGEGTAPVTGSKASSSLAKKVAKAASPKYKGMFGTIVTMTREEGPRALYSGIVPGLQRQMCFASVRIGLYDSVKQKYISVLKGNKGDSTSVGIRILAGITTGAMAVTCAQPTDVVKVRMQAQMSGPQRYKGATDAYRTIARTEGVKGLWRGTGPNIARNSIVNASELVSYDLIKEKLLKSGLLNDAMPCHFLSAFGAGFCTTCIASPVDVVKTRFMNSGAGVYKGALDCAGRMFREGGVKAFYKGFMPSFIRLASWNIVMFVSFEQMKLAIQHIATRSGNLPRPIPVNLETTAIVKPAPVPVEERHFPCTQETVSISLDAPSAALVWRV